MKNRILFLILFALSFSSFSQKKVPLQKPYVDSLVNSIEIKLSKEMSIKNELVISEINKLQDLLDSNSKYNISSENKLNSRIDNSLLIIDSLVAANNNLSERLTELIEKYNSNLKQEISVVLEKTGLLDEKTELLNTNISKSNSKISSNSKSLASTNSNLTMLSDDLEDKGQKGIIAVGVSLILILIVYILLNNKWNNETKKISLKQKEVLEKQVEDSQKLADWLSEKSSSELSSKSDDTDHSFAKRVADEIVRMSTNLSRMDDSIRGFKQLSASVRKLIQSLSINEYEIVELLNKPYSSGMNLEANFVFNEELEKGSQIITRIIKPQINYKGKMIQGAQVEVSQND
ncbi:MAG: hypothetical protein O3A49_05190 [Candidatus Marinimicrobia bacterium]|nr:hypothetical protein [Candidatus Neomarinimicrobiota bacterium]